MKTLIAAAVLLALPCGAALAQDSGSQAGTPSQPKVQWSYGGMNDVPTKGYWKQPNVKFGYNLDADDPTKGSNGSPKVSMGYGDSGTQTPSWRGNPAAQPAVAQHAPASTHS